MSEWYLRDASRKVKASHRARGMSGKRLTFKAIYGYMPDPNDKDKWIIDPETWKTAQRCRKTARRTDHGEANPLTGLVFCADCGAKHNHRQPYPTTQINKKGYVCI